MHPWWKNEFQESDFKIVFYRAGYSCEDCLKSLLFPRYEGVEKERHLRVEKSMNIIVCIKQVPDTTEVKIDPKTLTFGSQIDGNQPAKDHFYSVEEVLSPAELLLDSGAKVRLIGIESNGENSRRAVKLIEDMTTRHKVFLRFDQTKHDAQGVLLAYVYLRNKKHVNAHLIKSGLVRVDTRSSYRMKTRYLSFVPQEVR